MRGGGYARPHEPGAAEPIIVSFQCRLYLRISIRELSWPLFHEIYAGLIIQLEDKVVADTLPGRTTRLNLFHA